MKTTHFIFAALLTFSISESHGQIQINASGNIGMGSYAPDNAYTVRAQSSYYYNSHSMNSYSTFNRSTYGYVYESLGVGMDRSYEYTLAVNPRHTVENVLYISDGNGKSRGRTLFVNGDAVATGGWHTYSDRRMKKRERRIQSKYLFSKLKKVRGKRYEFKSEEELLAMHNAGNAHFPIDTIYKTKKVVNKQGKIVRVPTDEIKQIVVDVPKFRTGDRYGVAAQDVLAQYPELVSMDDATGMYAVDYQGFIPILLEAVNLQEEEISSMRKQLRNLKKKVNKLSKK